MLSYAGRMMLIAAVIMSLVNFWQGIFPLPTGCLIEIQELCAAFLWDGPNLNTRKTKIAWEKLCYPKEEGGLGFRSLKDTGKVYLLKMIWRLLTSSDSLWADWVRSHLLGGESFWSFQHATAGSWIFKKMLNLRGIAQQFHKVEVISGMETSFWFDNWSTKGQLYELCGSRGTMELGVSQRATVAEACERIRRRRHRTRVYREIQEEVIETRNRLTEGQKDIHLWRENLDGFKEGFNTKNTWKLIRKTQQKVNWSEVVWFRKATPKHSFIHWLACLDKLATKDKIKKWNHGLNSVCVLCNQGEETRDHLFLECPFSARTWSILMGKFLGRNFVADWEELQIMWRRFEKDKRRKFILLYTLQSTIYNICLERNRRNHGMLGKSPEGIAKMIRRVVINRIHAIKEEGCNWSKDTLLI